MQEAAGWKCIKIAVCRACQGGQFESVDPSFRSRDLENTHIHLAPHSVGVGLVGLDLQLCTTRCRKNIIVNSAATWFSSLRFTGVACRDVPILGHEL